MREYVEMPSLSKKQKWSIRRATKRLNFWEGSVRSGKTVATYYRWMQFIADAPPGDLLLIGRTIDSLKRNIISPIIELVGAQEAQYYSGRREFQLFGRTCHTIGASDERSAGKIQGCTVAGVLGDEVPLWPVAVFKMMLSRMSVKGAKFFGTLNPDNPNHWLKKEYLNRKEELEIADFKFSIDDNPYLDPLFVQQLKKEYTGLWYKRFILGEWCVAEGAIYDFFDEAVHCITDFPDAKWYDVAYDYGTSVPTTFGLYGNNPGTKPKVWLEREYYFDPVLEKRQKTDAELAQDFLTFIAPFKKNIRRIVGDPAAESFNLQLTRVLGRKPTEQPKDAKNDVLAGIRTVAKMLANGEYAIGKCNTHTIAEVYGYVWDPKQQLKGVDAPKKVDDHCMDRDRYNLFTNYGRPGYDINKFVD
jgi:PBSX family phage terminase large subunit